MLVRSKVICFKKIKNKLAIFLDYHHETDAGHLFIYIYSKVQNVS